MIRLSKTTVLLISFCVGFYVTPLFAVGVNLTFLLPPAQQNQTQSQKASEPAPNDKISPVLMKLSVPGGIGAFSKIHLIYTSSDPSDNRTLFVGVDAKGEVGVYEQAGLKTTIIFDHNTDIPDGVGAFTAIDQAVYDQTTKNIAFIGQGFMGQEGVYYYDGSVIHKIADQQSFAPNVVDRFVNFYHVSIDGHFIVFDASTEQGNSGLYLYDTNLEQLFKIVVTNDSVDNKKIESVLIDSKALSNQSIKVDLTFADKTSADYIVNFSLTPY